MKLTLDKNKFSLNADHFLRRAGYGFIRDSRTGHESYVRRLGGGFYPRLHMYFEEKENQIIFNLHLDQKQASYEGAHMHNGEYEGELVEAEINRLKLLIVEEYKGQGSGSAVPQSGAAEEEKSWWRRFFA